MTTPEEFIAAAKQAGVEELRAVLAESPSLAGAEDAQCVGAVLLAACFLRGDIAEAIAAAGASLAR